MPNSTPDYLGLASHAWASLEQLQKYYAFQLTILDAFKGQTGSYIVHLQQLQAECACVEVNGGNPLVFLANKFQAFMSELSAEEGFAAFYRDISLRANKGDSEPETTPSA